jgi:2-polyprenyl-6-methoxyphenol hydroxylase-like FAD-dependent oxidoreductase
MHLAWPFLQSVCQKTGKKVVTAILEDGRRFEGDILIGADGIWSKVCARQCLLRYADFGGYG